MSIKNDILDNLVSALEDISQFNGYNTDVKKASRFSHASDLAHELTPAVYVYETSERLNIEAETEIQYTITGLIVGIIKDDNSVLDDKAVKLVDDIKKLIYSPPSLGTYALDIQVTGAETYLNKNDHKAEIQVSFEIIYYTVKDNTAATLTGPYGTNDVITDGKTKLSTQLTAAKAAISGSYTPDFDYLYDRHQKASMRLKAVSIDFEGTTRDVIGSGTAPIIQHHIVYSIRVHTNYRGRYNDNEINSRLLESVANWLEAHNNLGDGYRIENIGNYELEIDFPESNTVGGQLEVTLRITKDYEQA